MSIPLYQVDAFTSRPLAGNPAAVCLLEGWLDDELLQAIAAENNLSETAFVVARADGSWDLRWFTPTVEVKLCGHATLACAHVLLHDDGEITFHSASGPLRVMRRGHRLTLDFPVMPVLATVDDAAVVDALGVAPSALYAIREVHHARYLLAEYPDESTIASLDVPLIPRTNVIVTAPGDQVDFVSRFFAYGSGIPEDPVTGSAHCTLTPFWVQRLGRSALRARQISRRCGDLWCSWDGGERVHIGGAAVTVIEGRLTL